MAFNLKPAAELGLDKAEILTTAATMAYVGISDLSAAKGVCVQAATLYIEAALATAISRELQGLYDDIEITNGPREDNGLYSGAEWDDLLDTEVVETFAEVRERIGSKLFADMATGVGLGRAVSCAEVGAELARVAAKFYPGKPEDYGKFLSSIGIVASDIETVQKTANGKTIPQAAADADARVVEVAETAPAVAEGISTSTERAHIAPPEDVPQEGAPLRIAPAGEGVAAVYRLFFEATEVSTPEMAALLGISVGSWRNYTKGLTPGKLSDTQGVVFLQDIDRRMALLKQAAAIIAGVKA